MSNTYIHTPPLVLVLTMSKDSAPRLWEKEQKPWGHYELTFKNEGEGKATAKMLTVDSHPRPNLQKHAVRLENWFVMEGDAEVNLGGGTASFRPGQSLRIPGGTARKLGSVTGTKVLGVPTGDLDKSDIVRLKTTTVGA